MGNPCTDQDDTGRALVRLVAADLSREGDATPLGTVTAGCIRQATPQVMASARENAGDLIAGIRWLVDINADIADLRLNDVIAELVGLQERYNLRKAAEDRRRAAAADPAGTDSRISMFVNLVRAWKRTGNPAANRLADEALAEGRITAWDHAVFTAVGVSSGRKILDRRVKIDDLEDALRVYARLLADAFGYPQPTAFCYRAAARIFNGFSTGWSRAADRIFKEFS